MEPGDAKEAGKAFADGDTAHHNNYGSYQLAKCIVQGIRDGKLGLAKYFAEDVAAFDPAQLDPLANFAVSAEPRATVAKPYSN